MQYEDMFWRNLGIFTPEEQARIRAARVLIVGCGGVGGVIAEVLARSGAEHLTLMDPEVYEPSNLNRQIACYCDTLGKGKAWCTRDAILRINPAAEVTIHERALEPGEMAQMVESFDVVACAADDWPLSMLAIDAARAVGTPAVMAYPIGAFGRTTTFLPSSPSAAECMSMPLGLGYEELKAFTESPAVRRVGRYYLTEGAWRKEWFDEWCEGRRPHAQLCTTVWLVATLAAMEIIKVVSGKWAPVVAPRYWYISQTEARIKRFSRARRLISHLAAHEWVRSRFPLLARHEWLLDLFTRLLS